MAFSHIKVDFHGRVCILTLNNPNALNAMDDDMSLAFKQTIEELMDDTKPRVLVVTGAGRAFSAGGNLDMIAKSAEVDPGIQMKNSLEFYNRFLAIRNLRIPTIAAVNGHAMGAGACLALACNMRMASENARFGFPFARLGLHPGMGAEYLLVNTVGEARTFELLMAGDIISAKEAERIGLVNHMVPHDQLMPKTLELAQKICAMPDLPIKMMKESIPAAGNSTLNDTLHRQAACQSVNYKTQDFLEGINALREKRKPAFDTDY